ncbi:MAG: polysaccharide lyase family 1 protein [Opitutaceae bacterium]
MKFRHRIRSFRLAPRRFTMVAIALFSAPCLLPGAKAPDAFAALPAFPGAEGFGRLARGGRGGDVYHVTNLNDAGPGSLREGITTARGPRTIVFEVGGEIRLKSALRIEKSFLTIGGQTAPGDGITVRDYSVQIYNATDVVLRYLRLRLGDEKPADAKGADSTLTTDDIRRVIIDHCSLSWAIDGTHDLRRGGEFTLQWCIISEALNRSLHNKGAHAMAASYRDLSGPITLHHNLIATCRDRHPSLGSAAKETPRHIVDFRNNLIYHWTTPGTANFCDHFINCINNVWRPGPTSRIEQLPIAMKGTLPDLAKGYMAGNVFEGRDDLTRDNYAALDFHRWLGAGRNYKYAGKLADWRADAPAELGAALPGTQPANEAAELVLARSGASLRRDAVDERVIGDVRNLTGRLIDSPGEVGGYPALRSGPAPVDTDRDGIPDAWESGHGLDPRDPKDANRVSARGYTWLEEYLDSLVRSTPFK